MWRSIVGRHLPVQHQNSLLIRGFEWCKPHRWLHGFGDRLGDGGVLLALSIRLYEVRRQPTEIMPKRGDSSSPTGNFRVISPKDFRVMTQTDYRL
jgi:hypothetical protein